MEYYCKNIKDYCIKHVDKERLVQKLIDQFKMACLCNIHNQPERLSEKTPKGDAIV